MPNPADFDLDFRPTSYWDHADPVAAILTNIKGDLRRRIVRDVLTAPHVAAFGELQSDLLDECAPRSFVERISAMHPQFMGGEYLPNCIPGEVEIARITLASVTCDVMSIRALRRRGRIAYRVVDEYMDDGGPFYKLTRRPSNHPLTLREVIRLIDTTKSPGMATDAPADADFIDRLRSGAGADILEMSRFVRVSSDVYPELERWYDVRADEWMNAELLEREDDDEPEDED